jgi:putative transposase
VAKWASFLQVSRSGYYEWLSQREASVEKLIAYKEKVKKIFVNSNSTYGPDRICGVMRKCGDKASYPKVSRLMADMGLSSIHNRHRSRSLTDSRKARDDSYKNLVKGEKFTKPYQAVCSDISYLPTTEGFLYLCIVKDIATGEILGESTSSRMKTELVLQAFANAHGRHPIGKDTIFHSDRGSQYTAHKFMDMLKSLNIKQSFSRVGMPGDNAWAESFFSSLKKERIHFNHFDTRDEASFAIFTWIEGFYNSNRVQKRLNYISPREYREILLSQHEISVA